MAVGLYVDLRRIEGSRVKRASRRGESLAGPVGFILGRIEKTVISNCFKINKEHLSGTPNGRGLRRPAVTLT